MQFIYQSNICLIINWSAVFSISGPMVIFFSLLVFIYSVLWFRSNVLDLYLSGKKQIYQTSKSAGCGSYKGAFVAATKRLLRWCFRRASAATSAGCCGGRNRRAKLCTVFFCGSSTAALILVLFYALFVQWSIFRIAYIFSALRKNVFALTFSSFVSDK